jgi:hypothetical protein
MYNDYGFCSTLIVKIKAITIVSLTYLTVKKRTNKQSKKINNKFK